MIGTHDKRKPPDPALVAARLDDMRRGRVDAAARKAAILKVAGDPVALGQLSLAEVQHYLTRKEREIALLWLGGYNDVEIAKIIGYSGKKTVFLVRRRANVKRFIELVQAAQLERVIAGDFGVRAQAKAAAPRVLRRVITKAGGDVGADGLPVGEAGRDGDQIRAADLVLQVAGEKEQAHEHLHKHLHVAFGDMTIQELDELGRSGKFPARYAALADRVGGGGGDDDDAA